MSKRKAGFGLLTAILLHMAPAAVSAAESYPVGWYDATGYHATVGNIAASGANIVLAYDWAGNPEYRQQYLDAAQQAGMKVIVEVPRAYVSGQDASSLSAFVQQYDSHPAVYGWYTADEPALTGISVLATEVAYAAVKLRSSKPVFMAFNAEESRDRQTIRYQGGYDILLYDDYPLHTDDSQFEDLSSFRTNVQRVKSQADEMGKPWWMIPQAMGRAAGTTWSYRLPTSAEERFMSYWAIVNDAEGLLYWAHYRTLQTVANPSMPYPYTGQQWIPEVWEPLAAELNLIGDALMAGKLAGMVNDNRTDVHSHIYMHPDSGIYYLIAVNDRSGSETATFTLNLPPGNHELSRLDGSSIALENDSFTDILTSYDVHVYQIIVPEPSTTALLGMSMLLLASRRRGRAWIAPRPVRLPSSML